MRETVEYERTIEARLPNYAVSEAVSEFNDKHDRHMVKKVEIHNCGDGTWLVTVEGGYTA